MNLNGIITCTILTMDNKFRVSDVVKKLKSFGYVVPQLTVRKAVERLRDNDYLEEVGYEYRVLSEEESSRW